MLKVLSINKFIKSESVLEVTNRNSFNRDNVPTDDGLYSNTIFGTSSEEISKTFGYINLKTNVLHPAILQALQKVSPLFKRIVYSDKKVNLVNGELIESDNGSTGIGWLFNNWNKIDFDKYKTEKNKAVIGHFQNTKRDELFISKYLVVPPKFRMFTQNHGITIEDELTMLYKNLLGLTTIGQQENALMQAVLKTSNRELEIQKSVIEIYDYFLKLLEKKEGAFRASLISKRIDNNVRLVANARPDIPFNCAGLPWHVLLNVFDVFVVGSIGKSIFSEDFAKQLNVEGLSQSKFGTHFDYIYRNVDAYTDANPGKREIWVKLLKEMFEHHPSLRVLLKRDPAWDKNSYHALSPVIIPTNSYHIVVNSLLYKPLGGDSFTTSLTLDVKDSIVCEDNIGSIRTKTIESYYLRSLDNIYK